MTCRDSSSSRGSERLRASLWGVAALCCALGGRPAAADDPKPDPKAALEEQTAKVTELEAAVAKHAAEKGDETLVAHAESARTLAVELSDAGLKARLVAVVGRILEGTRRESAQRPAIQALGALGESTGFRHLRPFLVPLTEEAINRIFTLEAIQAASRMRSDESVPLLLAIVRNSQDGATAVAAVKALDVFGENKPARERILADLVEIVRRDRPARTLWKGSDGGPRPKPPASESRYNALAGEMTTTLNKLTGQNVAVPEDWFDLAEKYKSDLAALWGGRSPAPAAPAAEKASPELTAKVTLLGTSVALHVAEKSDEALAADVRTAVTLSAESSDPSLRTRLADAVGALLEGTPAESVQRAAVEALGVIADPQGFRFIRHFLAPWGGGEGLPLTLEALEAAAKIKSDESVPVLMALVQNGEPMVAVGAVKAFAGFGHNKATREKIVLDLIRSVRDHESDLPRMPRPPPCIPWPEGGTSRFDVLAPVLTATLNAMTGRDETGTGAWFALVEASKGDMSGLFLDK